MDEARSVRDFWFGPLPLSAQELNRRMRFWFGGEPRRCASDVTRPSARASPGCSSAPPPASWPPGRTGRGGA